MFVFLLVVVKYFRFCNMYVFIFYIVYIWKFKNSYIQNSRILTGQEELWKGHLFAIDPIYKITGDT